MRRRRLKKRGILCILCGSLEVFFNVEFNYLNGQKLHEDFTQSECTGNRSLIIN